MTPEQQRYFHSYWTLPESKPVPLQVSNFILLNVLYTAMALLQIERSK